MTGAWRLGLRKSSPIHGGLWRERLEISISTPDRATLLTTAVVLAFICDKYIAPIDEVVVFVVVEEDEAEALLYLADYQDRIFNPPLSTGTRLSAKGITCGSDGWR